jgi:hypothetical protein
MTRLRRRGDDEGAALLLALAFLAMFGVTAALLLQFVWGGFQAAKVTHASNVSRTAANGAVDGAVNVLSRSTSIGLDPYSGTCFNLPASTLQPAVAVQCLARSGSGVGATGSSLNQPKQGVLTEATAASEGYVQAAGTADVVQGGVYAANVVSVGAGSTLSVTQGPLVAGTTCSTPATGVAPSCQTGTVDYSARDFGYRDPAASPAPPAYAPNINNTTPVTSVTLGLATVPACPASKVVTLSPGIYRSAAALNALTGGGCAGALVWLQPGVYDMDFADASDTWTLSDTAADVVGGTLTFTLPAARPSTVPFPTAASPSSSGCDTTGSGVVLVFAGDSRMTDSGSRTQLCAPPNSSKQQVAVWGPSTDQVLSGAVPSQTVAPSSSWSGKCAGSGDQVDPATGTLRHFAKVASQGNSCNLSFAPTGLSALVPSDATGIVLTVTNSGDEQGSGYTQATYTPPGGTTSPPAVFTPNCSLGCGSETAFTASVSFSPAQVSDLNNFSLVLSVVNNNQAPISAWLDSPVLTITYSEPVPKTSGAVATFGYAPASGTTAAVVRASGSGRLSVHGTIYAPLAALDLSETNAVNDLVDRGVVVRDLWMSTTIGSAYTGPLISVPPLIQAPRQLSLTAQIAGVGVVRAEVQFTDSTGTANGAVPHVLTWSQQ